MELAGHKNPRMRVLELDGDAQGYKSNIWLSMLGKTTAFSLCRSWHTGKLSDNGSLSIKDDPKGPFDVVVIPKVSSATICRELDSEQAVTNLVCCNSLLL